MKVCGLNGLVKGLELGAGTLGNGNETFTARINSSNGVF